MLNRSHIINILMLRKRENNIFHTIPTDITDYMVRMGDDASGPNSIIATLLNCVINSDVENVKNILDINPRMLLQTGDVLDSNIILNVTPYECALGSGNYEIASIIKKYFEKINEGEKHELQQYEKYKPYLEEILSQKPDYDLDKLMTIIIESSKEDIRAALSDTPNDSLLCQTLLEVKKHFSSCTIREGIHFNYHNFQYAYEIYVKNFRDMVNIGRNWDRCDLFWNKVLGPIKDSMPMCHRNEINKSFSYCKGGRKQLPTTTLKFSYTLEQCQPEYESPEIFEKNFSSILNLYSNFIPLQQNANSLGL